MSLTDWIQAISAFAVALCTGIIVLLTAGLVCITAWYAKTTKRMQEITVREHESRVGAIVDMRVRTARRVDDGFLVTLGFSNGGVGTFFLVEFKIFTWLPDMKPTERERVHDREQDVNKHIRPGQELEVDCKLDDDMSVLPDHFGSIDDPDVYSQLWCYTTIGFLSTHSGKIRSKGTLPTRLFEGPAD